MFNETKFDLYRLQCLERAPWKSISEFDDALADFKLSLRENKKSFARRWFEKFFIAKRCERLRPRLQH